MTTTLTTPSTEPTGTDRGSAYPPTVADLLPKAQALTAQLGALPSRNRLMRELRIGAGKAAEVLTQLGTGPTSTSAPATTPVTNGAEVASAADQSPGVGPVRRRVQLATTADVTTPTVAREAPPIETTAAARVATVRVWPVWLLALPAFVAIWSGWVGLGGLTGFGVVHPLPGIWDGLALNTAITLPIGMETYAAFALRIWLSGQVPARARRFARWSAITALAVGAAGQVAYHLMEAAGMTAAPWWITTIVASLPVAVLGLGAALAHLMREPELATEHETDDREVSR